MGISNVGKAHAGDVWAASDAEPDISKPQPELNTPPLHGVRGLSSAPAVT